MPKISTRAVMALVLLSAFGMGHAEAAKQNRYATSKSSYKAVGDLNRELTSACRKGVFNETKSLSLTIGFLGDKGYGVTGIAMKGFNLYDPLKKAQPGVTYHFLNSGYSNCQVYTATPKGARPGQRR
jgi:hypothetical protein